MISIKDVSTDETLRNQFPELLRYITRECPIEQLLDFEDPEYESVEINRYVLPR